MLFRSEFLDLQYTEQIFVLIVLLRHGGTSDRGHFSHPLCSLAPPPPPLSLLSLSVPSLAKAQIISQTGEGGESAWLNTVRKIVFHLMRMECGDVGQD